MHASIDSIVMGGIGMRHIADVYDANPEAEWNRLVRSSYNQLELTVFMHHISRNLPATGLVLDAGGGPGRYAVELCRHGLDVVLLDVSAGCIRLAEKIVSGIEPELQRRLRELVIGDITDLSRFKEEMFDAVLCLDPLSCISDPDLRLKALRELVRVAKPGAVFALGVRGYLDVLRTIARLGGDELVDDVLGPLRDNGNCLSHGVMHHFFRAQELKEFAEQGGLRTILMAGGEGLSSGLPEITNQLSGNQVRWAQWLRLVIETSTEFSIVDTSGHMLYLGRKD